MSCQSRLNPNNDCVGTDRHRQLDFTASTAQGVTTGSRSSGLKPRAERGHFDWSRLMRDGFDLIVQGMGGIMQVTGEPEGPPTSVGLPICDLGTGMWAVQGILAALWERQRTGMGRLVGAHCWKSRSASVRGHRRSGSPTTRSRPGRVLAIARTHPASVCRQKMAI
jgi:hypothetical protein